MGALDVTSRACEPEVFARFVLEVPPQREGHHLRPRASPKLPRSGTFMMFRHSSVEIHGLPSRGYEIHGLSTPARSLREVTNALTITAGRVLVLVPGMQYVQAVREVTRATPRWVHSSRTNHSIRGF